MGQIKFSRKGTFFYKKNNFFFKIYNRIPRTYSIEERNRRFQNEITAISLLKLKKCFFLPPHSNFNSRKFLIKYKKLSGPTVKECIENSKNNFGAKKIIQDILNINYWINEKKINLCSHNIKDLIYNGNKLYLVDYEFYNKNLKKNNFIKDIQYDLMLRFFSFDKRRKIKKTKTSLHIINYFFQNYKILFVINFFRMLIENFKRRNKN